MAEFKYEPLDSSDVDIYEDPNSQFIPPIGNGCGVSEAVHEQRNNGEKDDSTLEIEERVKNVIEKLRPYLQKDGGDIQYLGIENKWVHIKMLGSCNGCGSVGLSLVEIEEFLLEEINSPEIKGISWN